jgi:ABC-2 type transport system ATP-binding protein
MNVIEVCNLCRNFRVAKKDGNFLRYMLHRQYTTIEAVNNINFKIEQGELIGFIGPNGAGKSTTIKMMSGILVPTSGEIVVLGRIPHLNRKKNAMFIGVLFGQRSQLWWDLPVCDTFILLKKIYRIEDDVFKKNMNKYSEILGINEFINQPVRQLSLGQRMRADLCASLLHDPQILFLDEPTIGLDVVVKKQIREMIKEINMKQGVTVILTTHDMKDVEKICNRIIMIDKGKIIIDKPVKEVKNTFKSSNIMTIVFENTPQNLNIDMVENIELTDDKAVITYNSASISSAAIISDIVSKHKIIDITIKESEIDDIICNLYKHA